MIHTALHSICNMLNEKFEQQYPDTKKLVKVSNIVNIDGKLAEDINDAIICSLINIEQESSLRNNSNRAIGASAGDFNKTRPSLNINLRLIFYSTFSESSYVKGLEYLSHLVSFLQSNNSFEVGRANDPEGNLRNLNFELCSLDLNQLSHLFSSLGTKLMPSVMYKVRMLVISDRSTGGFTPRITDPSNKNEN